MIDPEDSKSGYASSPCMAADIAPDYFDPNWVDPVQARDVARWRRATRENLLAQRRRLAVGQHKANAQAIASNLSACIARQFGLLEGRVISAFWPIKSEPDLRPLMRQWHDQGAIVVLPVVVEKAAPMAFRRWTPETKMQRGDWNIPVPDESAPVCHPEIALAPLVGWAKDEDGAVWRLGFGGGYFDRTLAALSPRPFTIGIGLEGARLATIYPQPHDIALNAVVTEKLLER